MVAKKRIFTEAKIKKIDNKKTEVNTMLTDTILYNRSFVVTKIKNNVATIKLNSKIVERKIFKDKAGDDYFNLNNEKHWIKFLHKVEK